MKKTTFEEISKFYRNLYFNSLKEAIETNNITEEKGKDLVKLFEKNGLIEVINNEIKFTKKGRELFIYLYFLNEYLHKNTKVAFQS